MSLLEAGDGTKGMRRARLPSGALAGCPGADARRADGLVEPMVKLQLVHRVLAVSNSAVWMSCASLATA
jgi:hypothetical protein